MSQVTPPQVIDQAQDPRGERSLQVGLERLIRNQTTDVMAVNPGSDAHGVMTRARQPRKIDQITEGVAQRQALGRHLASQATGPLAGAMAADDRAVNHSVGQARVVRNGIAEPCEDLGCHLVAETFEGGAPVAKDPGKSR